MKIRRISQVKKQITFPNFDSHFEEHYASFLKTDLGAIYSAIPWQELVNQFRLRDQQKGLQTIFSPRGKIALLLLKHYACCSNKKLIEQLNANIHYQLFCDIIIPPSVPHNQL